MAIIRPPISKDQATDSWANQVTEAINKGLFAPSVNPADGTALIVAGGNTSATLYLYTRTTVASTPTPVDEVITYNYKTASFEGDGTYGSANWNPSPPNVINGDYLWTCVVNVSGNTEKEVIQASSWSTPQILSVNGSSSIILDVYLRSASLPSTPTGGSYNFSNRTLTVPSGGWSQNFPSGSNPVYVSTTQATVVGTTGTDSNLTWSSPIKLVEDGISATEIESGVVYYNQPSANSPGTPSATGYNFTNGAFTGLTSGWQTTPVTVNVTTTTALFWSSRFRITEASASGTPIITFDPPVPSVNFGINIQSDNYVTGSSGWQIQRDSGNAEFNTITIRGGLIVPSVVSAAITAKSITADQIDVDTLVIGSRNILTIDGSAVATRTHRTTVDDYTDGLNNIIVGSGSANGTTVTSGSASENLRYRFSVPVDLTSSAGSNNLRTKRFYYPTFTANSGYSIDGGNIEVFLVDDITSAQSTFFYVGTDSVDFYSAGGNNNSRQVVLSIGTNMYLNQAEILRLVDPAVEFENSKATQLFEIKFTADGSNVPSFTSFVLTAYAVNIEEFFQQSSPGLYNYTNTFEAITNVQLTGTTSTTAYVTNVNTSNLVTNGSGAIYGIIRGY